MAEFVENRLLNTLDEVEEMENLGLISVQERKKLIEKRREFEYRLARRMKNLNCFIEYVNYERSLLKLLHLRRKKVGQNDSKTRIEGAIRARLVKLLRFMTRKWVGRKEVWMLRIEFAKQIEWLSEVSVAYKCWLSYGGTDPSLWVSWAQWEIEGRNDFDKAREILLMLAPLYCPKSTLIHTEVFRLELLFVEELRSRKQKKNIAGLEEILAENREKVLAGGVAEVIYQNAIEEIPTPEMHIQLMKIAKKFTFAKDLYLKIFHCLLETFPNDDSVWRLLCTMAITEPENIPLHVFEQVPALKPITDDTNKSNDDDANQQDTATDNDDATSDMEVDTAQCDFVISLDGKDDAAKDPDVHIEYETIGHERARMSDADEAGTSESKVKIHIPTISNQMERISFLMDFGIKKVGEKFANSYVDELIKFLYNGWPSEEIRDLLIDYIIKICVKYQEHLDWYQYIIWYIVTCRKIETHPGCDKLSIIEKAIEKFPNIAFFKYEKSNLLCTEATTDEELLNILATIGKSLNGEYEKQIWCKISEKLTDEEQILNIFNKGIKSANSDLNKQMKIKHLEWLVSRKKREDMKQIYNKLKYMPPFESKIHTTVIQAELEETEPDIKFIRQAFETAVQQYGENEYGLWLSYFYFEKRKGASSKACSLRSKAEDQLNAISLKQFKDSIFDIDNSEEFQVKPEIGNLGNDDRDYMKQLGIETLNLFQNLPIATHETIKSRDTFFNLIFKMKTNIENDLNLKEYIIKNKQDNNLCWNGIMKLLVGSHFSIVPMKEKRSLYQPSKNISPFANLYNRLSRFYSLSDQLKGMKTEMKSLDTLVSNDVEELLDNSAVLKPEFYKQNKIEPYYEGKRKKKILSKKQRETSAGEGWFGMKAPEMTEDMQRNVDLLKMRSVLDPKQHYKGSSMKTTPKFFEIGQYIDTPGDFYNNKDVKKGKKRTLVEEIIHNESVLRYQKKKCKEIISTKQKKFRHASKAKNKGEKSKKMSKNNAVL